MEEDTSNQGLKMIICKLATHNLRPNVTLWHILQINCPYLHLDMDIFVLDKVFLPFALQKDKHVSCWFVKKQHKTNNLRVDEWRGKLTKVGTC